MHDTQNHDRLMSAYADMNAGRYEKARQTFNQLADAGEQQALVYLGWMDEQGFGGSANEQQAELRYKRLADSGDHVASYYYGALKLRQGSLSEALVAFVGAAEGGHPSAAYWASALYGGENGFPRNREKEIFYLKQAASFGHVYARRDLAKMQVTEAKSLGAKVKSLCVYFFEKMKGVYLISRNQHDPRVR